MWALGPMGENGIPMFHSAGYAQQDVSLEFGRATEDNCVSLLDSTPSSAPTLATIETAVIIDYTVMAPGGITMESLGTILIEGMDVLAPTVLGESAAGDDQEQTRMLAPLEVKLPTSIETMVPIGMCQ